MAMITPENVYDAYLFFHHGITFALFIAHVLYTVFAPDFLKNISVTVYGIIGMKIVAVLMKAIYARISKNPDWSLLPRCRYVTMGITALCAFLIRVSVFFDHFDYAHFSAMVLCFLIFILAINNHSFLLHECIIDYTERAKLITVVCSAHFVLLIASCRLATAFSSGWDTVAIIAVQVIFAPLCTVVTLDGVVIVMKDFKWKHEPVRVQIFVEEPEVEQKSCANCPICNEEYSTKNLPRVLKECGHTVCSACAAQRLAKHHNHYLFCATCRMITVVEGDVFRMAPNHALLALLEQLNGKL